MTMTPLPVVYVPELAEILGLLEGIADRLDRIDATLLTLTTLEVQEMADFSALAAEVTANGDVVASAVTLIEGIEQQLADLSLSDAGDQAQIDTLKSQLSDQRNALAQAVAAGTGPATPGVPSQEPPVGAPVGAPPADQPPADAPPADQAPADQPAAPTETPTGDDQAAAQGDAPAPQ